MIFKHDTCIKHLYLDFQRAGAGLDNSVDLRLGSSICQEVASDMIGFLGFSAMHPGVRSCRRGLHWPDLTAVLEEFPSDIFLYFECPSPLVPSPYPPYRRFNAKTLPTIFSFIRRNLMTTIFSQNSGFLMVNCQNFQLCIHEALTLVYFCLVAHNLYWMIGSHMPMERKRQEQEGKIWTTAEDSKPNLLEVPI